MLECKNNLPEYLADKQKDSAFVYVARYGLHLNAKSLFSQHLKAEGKNAQHKKKDGGSENGSAVLKKGDAHYESAASSLLLGASPLAGHL